MLYGKYARLEAMRPFNGG
ncbi:MAG TPA: hypothetical protein VM867_04880, partial [Xanthobacteraceae bacterium]|nr:hypothetical protein [Xanthobacteraceae bacterium]